MTEIVPRIGVEHMKDAAADAAADEALADAVVALLAGKREELRRGSHREAGATETDGSIEGDAA